MDYFKIDVARRTEVPRCLDRYSSTLIWSQQLLKIAKTSAWKLVWIDKSGPLLTSTKRGKREACLTGVCWTRACRVISRASENSIFELHRLGEDACSGEGSECPFTDTVRVRGIEVDVCVVMKTIDWELFHVITFPVVVYILSICWCNLALAAALEEICLL